MHYDRVISGRFIDRPNRFIAHVEAGGEVLTCHVKNTGRCRELLVPGCRVFLSGSDNPTRKTAYDLIAVEKGDRLINMDSQAPNQAFREWAEKGLFTPGTQKVRPEFSFGDSRLDFLVETDHGPHLVEVKGVTLEQNGHVLFPDAPTLRGAKHLRELTRAVQEGWMATVFFVVQMDAVTDFTPNERTDPAFAQALRQAAAGGVEVLAYSCRVAPDEMEIARPVKVILPAEKDEESV